MKTNLKLFGPGMRFMLAGLVTLMAAFSCEKEPVIQEEEKVENTLSVDFTEVNIDAQGEEVKIPMTTNAPLAEPSATHDWIVASVSEDTKYLLISAGPNTSGKMRSGHVTLMTNAEEGDQAKVSVKVTQDIVNTAELFKFGKAEYTLSFSEGSDQIALISDGPWEIGQNVPGWVEITPTSGDGDASLTVKYRKNGFVSERPSQIIFKNSKLNCSAILNLRQAGNPEGLNTYSHLGKGYDITGMYAYDEDVKASVLDCQKLFYEDHIADAINTNMTEEQNICGSSRNEYISNLTKSATATVSAPGLEGPAPAFGFNANITKTFGSNQLSSSDNSYATFRHLTKKLIIKTHENLTAKQLIPCLNDKFVEDCNTLSSQELILKYGTHVILGLSLGGVVEFSMCADMSTVTTEESWKSIVGAGFKSNTGIKTEASGQASKDVYNKMTESENYMYKSLICRGGESQFASSSKWTEGAGNENATYSSWLESLRESGKWVMVGYEGNGLIPLDQFITNPQKAAEVKTGIESWMSRNTLPPMKTKYGLFDIKLSKAVETSIFPGDGYFAIHDSDLYYSILENNKLITDNKSIFDSKTDTSISISKNGNTQTLSANIPFKDPVRLNTHKNYIVTFDYSSLGDLKFTWLYLRLSYERETDSWSLEELVDADNGTYKKIKSYKDGDTIHIDASPGFLVTHKSASWDLVLNWKR